MSWDTLDVQSNQDFTARFQTKTYGIANTTAYKVYRLYITANNGAPETQLAELTLVAGMSFYEAWSADFELSGSNAVFSANPDGDEQDNLNEYAMGGNPTNEFDWGHVPVFGTHDENGTNWFEYVSAGAMPLRAVWNIRWRQPPICFLKPGTPTTLPRPELNPSTAILKRSPTGSRWRPRALCV
jgi:hypothetical protein